MKEFEITKNEANQRLDKYIKKLLPNAGKGFVYKMLRKKNITWNGKKAEGGEIIREGDVIRFFFSEETFKKFSKDPSALRKEYNALALLPMKGLQILYEDEDILVLNKPYNMLSQKAASDDISANEYMLGYLIRKGAWKFEDMITFRPSVCNRLDRNTTGLLLAGKSLKGLQYLSDALKTREVNKYYRAVVSGRIQKSAHLKGYLLKNPVTNQVTVSEKPEEGAQWIETAYTPVQASEDWTLLEVHLITGRSHQIRAHLASVGHPVIGDSKYGNSRLNHFYRKEKNITHQMLHAHRIEFPDSKTFIAPLPETFSEFRLQ